MSAVVIEELTGQQRTLTLRGQALPYRGIGFGGSLRHKKTWYAGNQVATLQVLGVELDDCEMQGSWRDRFVADPAGAAASSTGFGTPVETASDLVAAFESLRNAGQRLRVSWGPFVRNGVLQAFEARPDRETDIAWTAVFSWDAADDARIAPATTDEAPDSSELREAQNASDDELAFAPPSARSDYLEAVRASASQARRTVGDVFQRVRAVQGQATVPLGDLGQLLSDAEAIRSQLGGLVGALVETPVSEATDREELFGVLEAEAWRRTQSRRLTAVRARVQDAARRTLRLARPEPLRVVEAREGDTLRRLAFEAYGTADEWQRIAEVNDLTDSLLVPGQIVIVPPLSAPIDPVGC